ncbi:glycoside hydrolase family 64 protein [Xylariomycetidae sp. FL0641]|nr:glycoside hydrolase family 64 protein [Xylariomycetidae sp. FL0641]
MPSSLQIALKNSSKSDSIYAYITGLAIQHGGKRCLLKADGYSLYFPQNPPRIGSPLAEDCAIPLGRPGHTVTVTIPQLAGGRVWFARDQKLTFLLNPGPALVEPSVLNPSDPNARVDFSFCEFTLNDAQLYANLSYVDFVPRLPIALRLDTAGSRRHHPQLVKGMRPDGLDRLAQALQQQAQQDGRPWHKLVVVPDRADGKPLRVLNATHGAAVGASFAGYFEPYVAEVWRHYMARQAELGGRAVVRVDTQAAPGVLPATFLASGHVRVGEAELFAQPTTADILGCNSGPFATGPSPARNAIIPRLAAAFARSALIVADAHPSPPDTFYAADPTNHYARLVHEVNVDRKGYAFPYDDVQPDGGDDQSGKVNAGDPVLWTITVGGYSG